MRLLLLLILGGSLATAHPSYAQSVLVTGTVTSSTDNGSLPGVNVVEKGTTNGTITDIDGRYSLTIPPEGILVFSSIGYLSQEVEVGNQTVIDVSLEEDVKQLDELVVVGYGTQKKSDLTGSIARVSGEDIRLPSTANFDQMLQGKVPGVQVSLTSGTPGGGANILVRGVSSITGGNQPLYVIDGYPIDPGGGGGSDLLSFGGDGYSSVGMANSTQNRINPLTFINPADIGSIDVLKDASATAIYGSRGANGVVIITTKRGSYNQSQIKLDVSYGVQEVANRIDLMNAQQYAEFLADGRDNAWVYAGGSASDPNDMRTASTRVRPEFRNPESITQDTDWQDVIFQVAPVQNYQISANTGNDKTKFYLSGGYFNQQGVIRTSEFQRFNLRSNFDAQLTDKLTIGTSLTGSHGFGRYPNTEGHYGTGNVLMAALAASPTIPVYDESGDYFFDQADVIDGLGWLANPLAMLEGYSDDRKITDILSNNFVEYSILDGLAVRSSLGVQYSTNVIKLWRSSDVPFFTTLNYPATAGTTKTERINWLNENTLTFRRVFNQKHSFDALVGFTAQKDSYDRLSAGASDFPTNYVTYLSAGIVNSGTHLVSEWAMLSFMSRINYAYDSKYLLTVTIRRDGSSRFGRNRQWGTFPSFSVGYNVSEEPFMDGADFINSLKLRASYGLSGNNQIGNFTHIGVLSPSIT
ncbi:MAG: SusC/RagA family TonB-linked outer membrane protein [Bacteroidota bacterium]